MILLLTLTMLRRSDYSSMTNSSWGWDFLRCLRSVGSFVALDQATPCWVPERVDNLISGSICSTGSAQGRWLDLHLYHERFVLHIKFQSLNLQNHWPLSERRSSRTQANDYLFHLYRTIPDVELSSRFCMKFFVELDHRWDLQEVCTCSLTWWSTIRQWELGHPRPWKKSGEQLSKNR